MYLDELNPFYLFSDRLKKDSYRANEISRWTRDGGVLILGYDMFKNLTNESRSCTEDEMIIFQDSLLSPGPDLVVCDEGHLLKNEDTVLHKAVNRIRTLRRIVLTGTPMQNNLKEYYCMFQFVKPNLLGNKKEFSNRFINPIQNGQFFDSTGEDIELMKRRLFILHSLLINCVQRKNISVLEPYLKPKHEFVVYIRLSPLQIDLYKVCTIRNELAVVIFLLNNIIDSIYVLALLRKSCRRYKSFC